MNLTIFFEIHSGKSYCTYVLQSTSIYYSYSKYLIMEISQAIQLIQGGIDKKQETWADIGAGTGIFSLALGALLAPGSIIYAVDKSPHALYKLPKQDNFTLIIEEGDFNQSLPLPALDGIIMANTLHYAENPINVLKNVLQYLKPGGIFLLIEYQTFKPLHPWIPFPLPLEKFEAIAEVCGLSIPENIGTTTSLYGHEHIYATKCKKL